MKFLLELFLSVQFGEIELSNSTVTFLLLITLFIFIAVGVSSLSLVQSAFTSDEED